jgi:hypothetical protein
MPKQRKPFVMPLTRFVVDEGAFVDVLLSGITESGEVLDVCDLMREASAP